MKFCVKVLGIVLFLMLSACQKPQETEVPLALSMQQPTVVVALPAALDTKQPVQNQNYLDGYNTGYEDRYHNTFAYNPLINNAAFNEGYVTGYKDATHAFTEVQLYKDYPTWVMFSEMQLGNSYRLYDGLKHESITFLTDDGQRLYLDDGTTVTFVRFEKLGYLMGKIHVRYNNLSGWVSLDQVLGGVPNN